MIITALDGPNKVAISPMLRIPIGPILIPTATNPSIGDRISGGVAISIRAPCVVENAASPSPPINTSGSDKTNQFDRENINAGIKYKNEP